MKSEAGENAMKSTTDQPTPSHEAAAQPSPRYAIRFESSMTRFAELTAASDRAHFAVLESAAGVVLEQILLNLDFAVPDGSDPFRCETIAGTLARHNTGAEGEDAPRVRTADAPSTAGVVYDGAFARAQKAAAEEAARQARPEFPEFDSRTCFATWGYENVASEDPLEISTALGTNTARTYRQLSEAMTILYGLPRFADRVRSGEFTHAPITVATQLCRKLAFSHTPVVDS